MTASAPGASVDSNDGVKLAQNKRLDDEALTDAGKALSEQRLRDLEANLHASISWEEAKLRLLAPFKR